MISNILVSGDVDERTREDEFPDCACRKKEEQSHKHGIFTTHLLRGLRRGTEAQTGIITYGILENYIEENMTNMKQKPFSFTAGSQIYGLGLIISTTDYHSYVERRKTMFASNIKRSSIYDTYFCSKIIKELEQYIAGDEEFIKNSIVRINDILSTYDEKIRTWIASNSSQIRIGIRVYEDSRNTQTILATNLDSLESRFNYDQFVGIDNQTLSLTATLYDYASKGINFNDKDLQDLDDQCGRLYEFIKKCIVTVPWDMMKAEYIY